MKPWRMVLTALFGFLLLFAPAAHAQVRYYYDELGRLVEVVAPDGASAQYAYDAAGNITSIRKLAATALSIAEFTPNGGPVGTAVTIYGSGFIGTLTGNVVKFNGTSATVTAATATGLRVRVPAGATSGPIQISNARGQVSSAANFTVGVVTPAPRIAAFTPQMGASGTIVTLSGTFFQPAPEDNKITIGGVPATVLKDATTPSATQLKFVVPAEVASGKITLTTPFGQAVSAADFYSLPADTSATAVEFKGRLSVNGPPVDVVINSPGKKAMLLFDGTLGQVLHLVSKGGNFPDGTNVRVYSPSGPVVLDSALANEGGVDLGGASTVKGG